LKHYVIDQWRKLLVRLQIPLLYQRVVVWWEFHSDLREQLKAARMFVQARRISLRNAMFGTVMLVATKQVQSRAELRDLSSQQIMKAWRAGRLDYLMQSEAVHPISVYGDKSFREWVNNGGQIKP
jgi:hypothetical protein